MRPIPCALRMGLHCLERSARDYCSASWGASAQKISNGRTSQRRARLDVLHFFALIPMEAKRLGRYSELFDCHTRRAMPKDSSNFIDSRILLVVRKLPEKRELSMGRVAQLPSRWPFKVDGMRSASGLLPAEGRPAPHQERSSFIT